MQGFKQAKKKFGQVTWLIMGLCFVLLYSCPVKKFLILYFDKSQPAESASAQFMKAHSAVSVKIVYLHKDPASYTLGALTRPSRHGIPSHDYISSFYFLTADGKNCPAADVLAQLRQRRLTCGPPRYLQMLRI